MWSPARLPGMDWTGPGVQVEWQESHWTLTGFQLELSKSEKNLTKLDFVGNHSRWIPGHFLLYSRSFQVDSITSFQMDSWSVPAEFPVIPGGFQVIPGQFQVNSRHIPGPGSLRAPAYFFKH